MTDLFAEDVSADDFALPSDADRVARMRNETPAVTPQEPAPEPETPVVEQEPAAETEPQTAAEDVPVAEPEQAPDAAVLVAQLEKRLADKDEFIGRLSNEVGQLRQAVEQVDQRVQQPAAVEVTADLIEANPAYAAQMAYDQNNGVAFQAAFEAWKEYDPTTAAVWAAGKQAAEQMAAMQSAYDERIAGLERSLAPVSTAAQANEAAQLAAARADQLPGFSDFILNTQQVSAMASEFPDEGNQILSGDPVQKVRALEKLYWVQRGRESDTHKATHEQVARETAQAAQQAREDAFVASSTTTSSGVKPSKAEQYAAEWDAMDAPVRDGWNL